MNTIFIFYKIHLFSSDTENEVRKDFSGFCFSSYSTNLRWVAILDNTEILSLSYLLIRVMEITSYLKGFYNHGVPLFPLAPTIRTFDYRAKMRECEGRIWKDLNIKYWHSSCILYPKVKDDNYTFCQTFLWAVINKVHY